MTHFFPTSRICLSAQLLPWSLFIACYVTYIQFSSLDSFVLPFFIIVINFVLMPGHLHCLCPSVLFSLHSRFYSFNLGDCMRVLLSLETCDMWSRNLILHEWTGRLTAASLHLAGMCYGYGRICACALYAEFMVIKIHWINSPIYYIHMRRVILNTSL